MPKFISIIGLTVLMLGSFVTPISAQSADILDITFENTPLFNDANFLPGDEVTRFVEVHNKDTENSYTIATKADDVANSDGLGDVMDLTIFNHDTSEVYYTGTLTEFFNAGVVELSELASGATIKYDYKIYFQYTAGDDYQGKTLGFDIIVGDGDSETIGDEDDGGGGGGGGGGGYSHSGLIISDERIPSVNDTSATITWTTNKFATSRVIYDTVSHPDLAGCPSPNYCYMFSNTEDSTMVTGHSMVITNLIPNTVYYFRPVSHASPEKTGIELTFTTSPGTGDYSGGEDGGGEQGGDSGTGDETPPPAGGETASGGGAIAGEQSAEGEEAPPAEVDEKIEQDGEVEGALSKCPFCPWWVWLIAVILHLWTVGAYSLFAREEEYPKNSQQQSSINGVETPQAKPKPDYPWLWWGLVISSLVIIFILFVIVCHFPAWLIGITLLLYLAVLAARHFILIEQRKNLWPFIPLLLAIAPIAIYLFAGSWVWWLWLIILGLYIASLFFYYKSLNKGINSDSWWIALMLLTLLTLALELAIALYIPCLTA